MTRTAIRRLAAMSVALALPLALLTAAPASAATVGVTTWSEIKAAFLVGGDTVRLDANITANVGDTLVIEAGESIILDLNGYALSITTPSAGNAAISVPPSSSLTINATGGGTITATGGNNGAGIGGDTNTAGGTTTINGGTITATGGNGGAGIGGGNGDSGGTVTINGGTTTATGGAVGAGIGGGAGGNGGTVTINGGTTTATGGDLAAGIGGGIAGIGGTVTINGGTTTATGGDVAAGIGGGAGGTAGVIQVNGNPDVGAATDGGNPVASPITNPITPAGVGYSAIGSADPGIGGTGGTIEVQFHYLITFAANGGSSTAAQTIDDGDAITEPAAPTREGFTFTGWTSGGSAYDFSTPVTAPLELTATWTAVLAATGTDVTTTLGIATLLLAFGAILIARRRGTTTRAA